MPDAEILDIGGGSSWLVIWQISHAFCCTGLAPPEGTFHQVDIGRRTWNEDTMRRLYLQRLRSLRSVDELLGSAIQLLRQTGQLDNTYIIFMSDNGFKIGNHGVLKGKMTAYEEDVRVPFHIRGPGIGQVRLGLHVHLAQHDHVLNSFV